MSRLARIAREVTWIGAGQVATVLGSLVLVRVLTEHLALEEFGRLSLGLTLAGLVNQLILGGITSGIVRFYPIAIEAGQVGSYASASFRIIGAAAGLVLLIASIAALVLTALGIDGWASLTLAAFGFALLAGLNSALSGILNAARQRSTAAIHAAMESWLRVGVSLCFVLWLAPTSLPVVAAYCLASVVTLVSQAIFMQRHPLNLTVPNSHCSAADDPAREWQSKIMQYSWPFCAWGIFTWAQQASDRWALESLASTEDVGIYTVVFQLGYTPIGMISGLAITFLSPILNQRSGAGLDQARTLEVHRLAWRVTMASLVLTALAWLVALLAHGWIFSILVAAPYRKASALLPWVVLAGGLFAAGQLLGTKLAAELRAADMMVMKITTAVGGVIFNILGARYFGVNGVAVALVAFSVVFLVWTALLAKSIPVAK